MLGLFYQNLDDQSWKTLQSFIFFLLFRWRSGDREGKNFRQGGVFRFQQNQVRVFRFYSGVQNGFYFCIVIVLFLVIGEYKTCVLEVGREREQGVLVFGFLRVFGQFRDLVEMERGNLSEISRFREIMCGQFEGGLEVVFRRCRDRGGGEVQVDVVSWFYFCSRVV